MFGIRSRLARARHDLEGLRDIRRLRLTAPQLVPSQPEQAAIAAELQPAYEDYVTATSTAGMAASLETSCYLLHLCRTLRPELAIDLGSGFSSYVLRRYATDASARVISVDDSAEWLGKTREFLEAHDVASDGLIDWQSFRERPTRGAGVVFHDLAGGTLREQAMPLAVEALTIGGVAVLDDAQHDGHRSRMRSVAEEDHLRLFSLRKLTLDRIGRWSMLALRLAV